MQLSRPIPSRRRLHGLHLLPLIKISDHGYHCHSGGSFLMRLLDSLSHGYHSYGVSRGETSFLPMTMRRFSSLSPLLNIPKKEKVQDERASSIERDNDNFISKCLPKHAQATCSIAHVNYYISSLYISYCNEYSAPIHN